MIHCCIITLYHKYASLSQTWKNEYVIVLVHYHLSDNLRDKAIIKYFNNCIFVYIFYRNHCNTKASMFFFFFLKKQIRLTAINFQAFIRTSFCEQQSSLLKKCLLLLIMSMFNLNIACYIVHWKGIKVDYLNENNYDFLNKNLPEI